MSKLKVAIVAPSLRILGGHSVQAQTLLRGWSGDPEVDAWLVPIDPVPPGLLAHGVKVKYLRTAVVQPCYLASLVRHVLRADVVHVFSASYWSFLLAPLPAVLVTRVARRPVVLNYHSGEAPDHLARSSVARRVIRSADRCAVPSAFLKDVFAGWGLDSSVVPNVVDVSRFSFAERDVTRARVLSTRNLGRPYNVACTIKAFAGIQQRLPAATLTVVGDGPDRDALQRLVAGMDLRGVTFAGRVEPAAMPEIYGRHDLYIQSPDVDNMPLSVLEAFASGLPVVSTDVGGMRVILEHGRDGLLSPARDAATLAANAVWLLTRPDEARLMAHAAHQRLTPYAWPTVRQQWLDIYRSALSTRGPALAEATA